MNISTDEYHKDLSRTTDDYWKADNEGLQAYLAKKAVWWRAVYQTPEWRATIVLNINYLHFLFALNLLYLGKGVGGCIAVFLLASG